MTLHEQIVQAFNNYLAEAETFDDKGVKAAATRAVSYTHLTLPTILLV